MALAPAALQALMTPAIYAALQAKFPTAAAFPEQLVAQLDLADAIATGVSNALVPYLISSAVVVSAVPGTGLIGFSGTPITGSAVGTGAIT